jgi:elongation factor G
MKDIPVSDVRTFVLLGHPGSGKTSLADALLFKLGVNDRLGLVDTGSSMADYTDEEKARKITLYAKPFSGVYPAGGGKRLRVVFCDTPGYMDFIGQVIQALRIAGSALIAVDAASGIQVGSTRAWKQAEGAALPRGIVVTGLDKENASFARVLGEIRAAWGARCVPVVVPLPDASGAVDVLAADAVPPAVADAVQEAKGSLVELAAEADDSLIEKYLGGETLSADEIGAGLREAVLSRRLVPVFACLPLKDVGVTELLEGLARLFPSPQERPMRTADGQAVDPSPSAPFTGFVWRTVNDAFVGQLSLVYVCGGTFRGDLDLVNAARGQKERVTSPAEINGKKQTPVEQATAGEIVALTKLKVTALGDALCAAGHSAAFAPLVFPNPVIWQAVTAKTQGDEDRLGVGMQRLVEEDPTIRVERNPDTHETILSGMGDVQIAVAVERLKRRSNVDVVLSTPKVPYKETVTTLGEGHYRHKKQTGGRGQYGEVYLRVEPRPPGDEEWFVDAIVGGVIPNNFIPAVQKGVVEGMSRGTVAGYPVINVKSSVHDGSYHEVDSSEISFKIAGARAFKDAMSKARPVLLEPIMTVKVMVPEQFMGEVNGDMSHRRGRIMGMESADGMQLITAEVPQAELFRYCAELRSMTGGRGSFEMAFARYEIVPSNVAQKVVAEAEKTKQEVEE